LSLITVMTKTFPGLFERMESVKDENALTEALAICLEASAEFRKQFLQKAGAGGDAINIETRKPDAKSKKIPDLTISRDRPLLLFEIKEHARLHAGQWNNYRKLAEDWDLDPDKSVFAIVAPRANMDGIRPPNNIWRWTEIYKWADDASTVEPEEVGKFLLHELTTFLAGRDMMPFDGFAQQDIDTLTGLLAVRTKLKNFLQGVFDNLSQNTDKSRVVLNLKRIEETVYKGYPGVYGWVEFQMTSKSPRAKPLNVWIGNWGYESSGPTLALGVWTTDHMFHSDAEQRKWQKKLAGIGLKWDKDEQSGFMKVLKTEIQPSESDPNLLRNVVQEVQEIIEKVSDRL
jgi:hypothetical protein